MTKTRNAPTSTPILQAVRAMHREQDKKQQPMPPEVGRDPYNTAPERSDPWHAAAFQRRPIR